jgi:hypothetical protein
MLLRRVGAFGIVAIAVPIGWTYQATDAEPLGNLIFAVALLSLYHADRHRALAMRARRADRSGHISSYFLAVKFFEA